MEYCCHVWAGVPSSYYLELLDKLQKRICKTFGPSLDASLEPLVHRRNVAGLSLFCITLVHVHLNWLNWFHFLFFEGGLLVFYDFSVTIPRFQKDVYVNTVSFLAKLNCLMLSFDLSGSKSRIKRQLLTKSSFLTDFLCALIFLCFFFLYLHASQWLFSFAWSESELKQLD